MEEAIVPVSYAPCSATTYCNSLNYFFGGDNYLHRYIVFGFLDDLAM